MEVNNVTWYDMVAQVVRFGVKSFDVNFDWKNR